MILSEIIVAKKVHKENEQAKQISNITENCIGSIEAISFILILIISSNIAAFILYSFLRKAETTNIELAKI